MACLLCVTAHSMMQKRIVDLVVESFGVQSYKKAMDCLTVLRAESVKVWTQTLITIVFAINRLHYKGLYNSKCYSLV